MKKIPEGWRIVKYKDVTRNHSGNSTLIKGKLVSKYKDGLYPSYSASGQDVWHHSFGYEGEAIIVSAVGSRCGKVFLASNKWNAIANTHVVWPNKVEIDTRFLMYHLSKGDFWLKGGSGQAFVLVKHSLDKNLLLPPLPEQEKIAEILGSVDAAIDATRRVIEQTRTLKRALMQQLLTRGIPGRHRYFSRNSSDSAVFHLNLLSSFWGSLYFIIPSCPSFCLHPLSSHSPTLPPLLMAQLR